MLGVCVLGFFVLGLLGDPSGVFGFFASQALSTESPPQQACSKFSVASRNQDLPKRFFQTGDF